jgi:hypothetical protein
MRWRFKQQTPGFGISKSFYLTVLSGRAQLPPLRAIVRPDGLEGTVAGFGVPLAATAQKEDLERPLERGFYGIASKNRETVLKLLVVPHEEAGFDPEPFLRSPEASLLTEEHRARISATWSLLQLTFETHEAMVYNSLKFFLDVSRRLAEVTDGVVSDPISRLYLLPDQVVRPDPEGAKINATNFVKAWHRPEKNGWSYTLGMQKFDLPEYEIFGVPSDKEIVAERFLVGLAQSTLSGEIPTAGALVGSRECPLQVAVGGLDRAQWEGTPCFELIPATGRYVVEALEAWRAGSV